MVISLKYNFLFVHIDKTGGTSIRSTLSSYRRQDPWYWAALICSKISHMSGHRLGCKIPRHAKAIAAYEMLPREFYDSLFKFTFVRNPWDREVSRFHHNLREYPHLMKGLEDFETFLRWKLNPDRPYNGHFTKELQSEFAIDLKGNIILDYIGRFENLQDDFRHVCRTIGIEPPHLAHKRKAKDRKEYRKYYNDSTAALIAEHYSPDIEMFGYTFD